MKWHGSLSQSHFVERAGRDHVQNDHLRMILIILSIFINSHDFFSCSVLSDINSEFSELLEAGEGESELL